MERWWHCRVCCGLIRERHDEVRLRRGDFGFKAELIAEVYDAGFKGFDELRYFAGGNGVDSAQLVGERAAFEHYRRLANLAGNRDFDAENIGGVFGDCV